MKYKRFSESERNMVVTMWNNGQPVSAIARLLPYSIPVVRREVRLMVERGEITKIKNRVSNATTASILIAYDQGVKDPREIANLVGCAYNTAKVILTMNHKSIPRKSKYKKHTVEDLSPKTQDVIRDILYGKKAKEITGKHGVSRQYVSELKGKIERGDIEI